MCHSGFKLWLQFSRVTFCRLCRGRPGWFFDPPLSDPPSVSMTKAVASNRLTGQLFHLEGEPLLQEESSSPKASCCCGAPTRLSPNVSMWAPPLILLARAPTLSVPYGQRQNAQMYSCFTICSLEPFLIVTFVSSLCFTQPELRSLWASLSKSGQFYEYSTDNPELEIHEKSWHSLCQLSEKHQSYKDSCCLPRIIVSSDKSTIYL